jgi:CSLREA domain-containing protein
MHHPRLIPLLLAPFVLVACTEDRLPTAPAERGGPVFSHTAGHKVVNSLADPGNGVCNATQCTLREAINEPGSTEITFAPGLTGTIRLAPPGTGGGRLEIDKALSITGPSQRIILRGRRPDNPFPVFRIGEGGTVTLANLTVRAGGSGLVNRGTVTLSNIVAESCGTGISSQFGTLALSNSFVINNSDVGVRVVHGMATLRNDRIAGNALGGISVFNATVTLARSTVARNAAANGGGIFNDTGRLSISRSTITNNSATGQGGGIFNTVDDPFRRQSGSLTLTNSTVSGNTAGSGGGISNTPERSSVELIITNSTVARNSATLEGGGIFQRGQGQEDDEALLVLRNSLVAQNSAPTGPDVSTNSQAEFGFVSARFSLVGNGTGSGITNTDGNQVGNVAPNTSPIDPRLGPLADNGGPTRTHALLTGSPAIDAASAQDCPPADQRGVLRPQGAACDIGSYERE